MPTQSKPQTLRAQPNPQLVTLPTSKSKSNTSSSSINKGIKTKFIFRTNFRKNLRNLPCKTCTEWFQWVKITKQSFSLFCKKVIRVIAVERKGCRLRPREGAEGRKRLGLMITKALLTKQLKLKVKRWLLAEAENQETYTSLSTKTLTYPSNTEECD